MELNFFNIALGDQKMVPRISQTVREADSLSSTLPKDTMER